MNSHKIEWHTHTHKTIAMNATLRNKEEKRIAKKKIAAP